jgi:hypothetical protein
MKKIFILFSLITFFFIENIFCKKDKDRSSTKKTYNTNYIETEIDDSFDKISYIEEKNINKKILERTNPIENKRRNRTNPLLPFLHKNPNFPDENNTIYGVVPQKNKTQKNAPDYIKTNNYNLNDIENMSYDNIEKIFSDEEIDINEILNDDSIDWDNIDFDTMDFDNIDF